MFRIVGWLFSKSRNFFKSALGKAIAKILVLLGISVGTAGAVEAGKAIKLNRHTKKIRDEALRLHEEHYQKVQASLMSAGKAKLTAISAFSDFADYIARIQCRPEFGGLNCKGVNLPTFTAEDLKIVSNNVVFAIEGTAYAGAGAGLGIAVCGLNILALGPGILISGIGLLIAGEHLKNKAIENNKQAKQLAQDVNSIVKQYDELSDTVVLLEKHIVSVHTQLEKYLRRMDRILSKKTVWSDMSEREHTIIENNILLVGLLYKLCKIELIEEKKQELINTTEVRTIGAEVETVLKHTKRWSILA